MKNVKKSAELRGKKTNSAAQIPRQKPKFREITRAAENFGSQILLYFYAYSINDVRFNGAVVNSALVFENLRPLTVHQSFCFKYTCPVIDQNRITVSLIDKSWFIWLFMPHLFNTLIKLLKPSLNHIVIINFKPLNGSRIQTP